MRRGDRARDSSWRAPIQAQTGRCALRYALAAARMPHPRWQTDVRSGVRAPQVAATRMGIVTTEDASARVEADLRKTALESKGPSERRGLCGCNANVNVERRLAVRSW